MSRFIEVTNQFRRIKTLVNLHQIEEIRREEDGSALIIYAFQRYNKSIIDTLKTIESYEEVKAMIIN